MSGFGSMTTKSLPVIILVATCDVFILIVYVWFVSIGTWTKWPTISDYLNYDQLATAFRDGQLSLEIKPDPGLLALADPYDPVERKGTSFPSDASLYKGNYYLYFGPTPALILLIAKAVIPGTIGDQYLVFAFISGIFLVGSFFVLRIWRSFFPEIALWKVGSGLLVVGLTYPLCRMLGIPVIYNTAVLAGQFFFLAGLYIAFDGLDREMVSKWELVVTGALWAAALGSRITQIFPIGFLLVLMMIGIIGKYRRAGRISGSIEPLLALGLPLAIGLIALGWYNWARFDSVFETGITYQLAGIDLQSHRSVLLSPTYIIQNLYNYLLHPPKLVYSFPWFRSVYGIRTSIVNSLPMPEIYTSQDIVGLLYSAPFVVFSIIPVSRILVRRATSSISKEEQGSFNWLIIALMGSFFSGAVFYLAFFFAVDRYLLDFLPELLLLSVIGFWQLGRSVSSRQVYQAIYVLIAIILVLISIIVGNLLALDVNNTGFKALNPLLWRQLSNLFRP
jgi:hypothetical protein